MPTPVDTYFATDNGTNALVLGPFTPVDGQLLVVLTATWDTANPTGASSGGGQTYTTRKTAAPGGFNGYARIDTATVSGSPGPMSVTVAGTGSNARHSAALLRYPAGCTPGTVNSTVSGTGAPSANVTTGAANSGVVQVSADVASQDPAGRAYRNSAVEVGILDGHVGANSVQYHAYVADIGPAGTYAIGLTAPGSQTWVLAALEIIAPSGATLDADASLTETATVAATAAVARPGSASVSATAAATAAAAVDRAAAATMAAAASLTSTATTDRRADAGLAVAGAVSAAAVGEWAAASALTAAAAIAANVTVTPPGGNVTPRPDSGTTARPDSGVTLRP